MKILTGFHPIEEKLRVFQKKDNSGIENVKIFYANPGPRVKKILALAKTLNIKMEKVSSVFLLLMEILISCAISLFHV